MTTAIKAFQSVKESAENIRCGEPQRFPEAASFGEFFRQGDIYVTLLESVPCGFTKVRVQDSQLAPGTTKGSRHILDSLDGVVVYELLSGDALIGPVIEIVDERVVTHPEHGDLVCPPGVYGITYQRAFAEELRRVVD